MARLRFAVVIPALLLAACGSNEPTTTPSSTASSPTGATVAVELKEFSVTPTPASFAAGAVTFDVKNSGTIVHEFVVFQTDLAVDALPVKDHLVEEDKLTSPGEIEDIAVGATQSKAFTLTSGKYVLICNVATHYESGMRAAFTVT